MRQRALHQEEAADSLILLGRRKRLNGANGNGIGLGVQDADHFDRGPGMFSCKILVVQFVDFVLRLQDVPAALTQKRAQSAGVFRSELMSIISLCERLAEWTFMEHCESPISPRKVFSGSFAARDRRPTRENRVAIAKVRWADLNIALSSFRTDVFFTFFVRTGAAQVHTAKRVSWITLKTCKSALHSD
jgi:hypothetical protein